MGMKRTVLIVLAVVMTGSICWAKTKISKDHYEEVDGDRRFTVGGEFNIVDRELALPMQSKWQADLGGAVIGVTLAGDRVLAISESGVHAVDSATGNPIWHYDGASGKMTSLQSDGSIVFFSSYVYGADKEDHGTSTIHVLDLETGSVRWTHEKEGGEFTSLSLSEGRLHAVLATPNAAEPEEGMLCAWNTADGSKAWEHGIAEKDWIYSSAISAHGVVVIAMRKPYEFNIKGVGRLMRLAARFEATTWTYGLEAYDAASGTQMWTRVVEGTLPLPTRIDHLLATEDGVLYPLLGRGSDDPKGSTFGLPFAVDIKTGEAIWEQKSLSWSDGGAEMKYWANVGYLAEDRYLYGQGIGDEAQVIYVMCVDIRKGEMLWREHIKSDKLGNFMKSMAANARTGMSKGVALSSGASSYRVHKSSPSRMLDDSMSIFTDHGIIVNFPGEDKVRRYVGGKKMWETKYKKKKEYQMVLPTKVTRNHVVIGDSSGKVRFLGLLKGKNDKQNDIDLGGALYQMEVTDELILFAAETGLHAY
jgi:outer membrane protein assembly factor BamB